MGQDVCLQTTYDELRDQIETLKEPDKPIPHSKAPQSVVTTLVDSFKARSRLLEERKKPLRKPGTWVQHWVSTFCQFLSNYQGIVEVIKGADQQYGGLAYGTLAALLAVPVNKDQHERVIEEALDEFSLAFPRLQNLEDIYPEESENFKLLVARIYVEVILFAQECTSYYLKTSLGKCVDPNWCCI